jgi:hypothetical protein
MRKVDARIVGVVSDSFLVIDRLFVLWLFSDFLNDR